MKVSVNVYLYNSFKEFWSMTLGVNGQQSKPPAMSTFIHVLTHKPITIYLKLWIFWHKNFHMVNTDIKLPLRNLFLSPLVAQLLHPYKAVMVFYLPVTPRALQGSDGVLFICHSRNPSIRCFTYLSLQEPFHLLFYLPVTPGALLFIVLFTCRSRSPSIHCCHPRGFWSWPVYPLPSHVLSV